MEDTNVTPDQSEQQSTAALTKATERLVIATILLAIFELGTVGIMCFMLKQNDSLIAANENTSRQLTQALKLFCQSLTATPATQRISLGVSTLSPNQNGEFVIQRLESVGGITVTLSNPGSVEVRASLRLLVRKELDEATCEGDSYKDLSPGQRAEFSVDIQSCLSRLGLSPRGIVFFRVMPVGADLCGVS